MPPAPTTERQRPATFATLRRLWPWVRPVSRRIALGGLSALLASLIALAVPQVLRVVVNGPLLTSGSTSGLLWASLAILGLSVLEAFLLWGRRAMTAGPATRTEQNMRTALFRRLVDLPVGFHDRTSSGQLLQRSMGDLNAIRRWMAFGIIMLVVALVTIIAGVALMATTAWQLGLIYVAGAIPVVWLTLRFRIVFSTTARLARDQAGDLAARVEESVHGIRVLKAFGRGEDMHEDFVRQADELRGTEVAKAGAQARITAALTAIPEAVLALSLGVGIWLAVQGTVSVGALVAFFATAAVVNRPVEMLGNLLALTLDAAAALARYVEVMDREVEITDPPDPVPIPAPASAQGSTVEFRDVVVTFPDATRPLLDHLTLTLEPGRTTALVGVTGSGKSTLLALVPRLLDPSEGAVLIDGVDISQMRRSDLRTLVAPAFEDSVLFSTTVRENVLLGVDDDPAADALLDRALSAAQADFVRHLPGGVDTRVGEEGMSLSGGQRQRLALARAIAARPRVLVLDDPLSAVDVATEARATEALREILPGTTTLVVAHRPSTVAMADHVVLLDEGRIAATGTHRELMASSAQYRYVLTAIQGEVAR